MIVDLPSELILTILAYLPIHDCNSLLQAVPHARLKSCLESRTSIREHLTKHVFEGAALLKAMAASEVLLVGALALDFFVPGMSNSNATWTFLVPSGKDKTYPFLKFLESRGVRWRGAAATLDALRAEVQARGWDRFQMNKRQFCLAARGSNEADVRALGELWEHSTTLNVGGRYCNNAWQYRLTRLPGCAWDVVHGRIHSGSAEQNVQVILSREERSPYEYLEELPSTSLQCFITGFGAVHMYGTLTAQGQHHVWTTARALEMTREGRWIDGIPLQDLQHVSCESTLPSPIQGESNTSDSLLRDSFDREAIFIPTERISDDQDAGHEAAARASCHLIWKRDRERDRDCIALQNIPSGRVQHSHMYGCAYPLSTLSELYLAEYGLC